LTTDRTALSLSLDLMAWASSETIL